MRTKVVTLRLQKIRTSSRSPVSIKERQCARKARDGHAQQHGLRHDSTEVGGGGLDGLGEERVQEEIVEVWVGHESFRDISQKDTVVRGIYRRYLRMMQPPRHIRAIAPKFKCHPFALPASRKSMNPWA
jgi:hypothetical protein